MWDDTAYWNWYATYLEYWCLAKGFEIHANLGEFPLNGSINDLQKCGCTSGNCGGPPPPPGGVHDGPKRIQVSGSVDPNEKATIGVGVPGFITGDDYLTYTIRFENLSTANAPAQEVVVTDTLSPSLDWSSFELLSINFACETIDVESGHQNFERLVTVTTDPNPVRVTASLDPAAGKVTWRMVSEDLVTHGLPEDPQAGFLPPNDESGCGQGYVSFRIRLKAGLLSGTEIKNKATIVFDVNPPIETNEVINTIDDTAPASHVVPLPETVEYVELHGELDRC